MDGVLQKLVPKQLRSRVLFFSHYPGLVRDDTGCPWRLQRHPGLSRMYETMRRVFYERIMDYEIY